MLKKILFVIMMLCITVPAGAFELLMFSSDRCSYCQNFLKEVKPEYSESKYSKTMPLKVINIDTDPPKWAEKAMASGTLQPIRVTPTFVLWDNNKEVVRTEGYRSKEHFYMIMDAFSQNVSNQKGPLVPFIAPDRGGKPSDKRSDRHNRKFIPGPPPEGVIDSRDLYQHMYQTAGEALKGAQWLGCGNNVHFHEDENVWMPCMMEFE